MPIPAGSDDKVAPLDLEKKLKNIDIMRLGNSDELSVALSSVIWRHSYAGLILNENTFN